MWLSLRADGLPRGLLMSCWCWPCWASGQSSSYSHQASPFVSLLPSETRRNGEFRGSDFPYFSLILDPSHPGHPVITIKMHMYKCQSLLRSFRIKSQCCALFPHPIVLCSCFCFVPCPTLDGALLSAAELAHPLHHLHFVLVHLASLFMFPSRCFFREPVFLGLDQGPCSLTSCTFSC